MLSWGSPSLHSHFSASLLAVVTVSAFEPICASCELWILTQVSAEADDKEGSGRTGFDGECKSHLLDDCWQTDVKFFFMLIRVLWVGLSSKL